MTQVKAEMAASVWRVLVAVGDRVEVGDELVVLESMKIEIPVVAETAGRVSAVHVTEGSSVEEDEPLMTISPD